MARVGDEERERIVSLLKEHGGNQNKVAKLCGRPQRTVGRIANGAGIKSLKTAPKKALATKAALQDIDRMEIIGLGLHTGAELLRGYQNRDASIENIRAYKDLMTGLAIGIDKHRLETGQVTNRTESRKGDEFSLEDEFSRLDASLEAQGSEESTT